ncbi:MAG: MFS transporter [Verrucomicrobia bacterium]|nr:MFS transporter [Cytophagales bacterium]
MESRNTNEKSFLLLQTEARTGHILKKDQSPYNFSESEEALFTVCDSLDEARKRATDLVRKHPSVEVKILNANREEVAIVRDKKSLQKPSSFAIPKNGTHRWNKFLMAIFAMLAFFIVQKLLGYTIINEVFQRDMMDMADKALLNPQIQQHFTEQMQDLVFAVIVASMLGGLLMGWLTDRVGVRHGLTLSIALWGLSSLTQTLTSSIRGTIISRCVFTLGESGLFSAVVKLVSIWFPKLERAWVLGALMALGSVLFVAMAWLVPWLATAINWRFPYILIGLASLGLAFLIFIFYCNPHEQPEILATELQYIQSDKDARQADLKMTWGQLFAYKQLWGLGIFQFFTQPVQVFALLTLPLFLQSQQADFQGSPYNFNPVFLGLFIFADLGGFFFGWLSSQFYQNSGNVVNARKTVMLICAVLALPALAIPFLNDFTVSVALAALALAAYQGWLVNVYTLASDIFPKNRVGSVVGISSSFGALGVLIWFFVGKNLQITFGYQAFFILFGVACLVAWLLGTALVSKLKRF